MLMFILYFYQEGLVEIREEYVEGNFSEQESGSGWLLYLSFLLLQCYVLVEIETSLVKSLRLPGGWWYEFSFKLILG